MMVGKRLAFVLNLDAFFGLNRLMQPFAVAAALHETASKLVDDDDFVVLHHVVLVALHQDVRLKACVMWCINVTWPDQTNSTRQRTAPP